MLDFKLPTACVGHDAIRRNLEELKKQGVMHVNVIPLFDKRLNNRLGTLEVEVVGKEGWGDRIIFKIAHESGCSIPFVVENFLYDFDLRPTWGWTLLSNGVYNGQFGRRGSMKEVDDSGCLNFKEVL